jgi:3-methyl-2-oxobutanoate hydroxymethyltransferase
VPADTVSLSRLQEMKHAGQKVVAVVAWDYPTAQIADRAGVDILSVGDSVGVNLWGRTDEADVTLEEMLLVCSAVRRGVQRALVSCDLPARAMDVAAARRLVDEGGADVVKVDDPDAAAAIAEAGIDVFAQLSGGSGSDEGVVAQAQGLERGGASLLDFRHSGPLMGPKVVEAVSIPVLGGLGGGPWLDGRIRTIHRAIGYGAFAPVERPDSYADVAQITHDAIAAYADDVRAGRDIKGG